VPHHDVVAGTVFERIFSYHADTVALGAMAQRAGVPTSCSPT
jgi:ribonuclease Z